MEIVSGISFNDCSSIFFNRPTELIDALIAIGDGLFGSTRAEHENLAQMIDTAKYRAGLSRENTFVDNIFKEINYRLLEKKTKLLFEVQQSMGGITDVTMERVLHGICLDKVNEV
jgi:hypothetical protein